MVDSLVRGAALGLVPIVIWVLVGEHRRKALSRAHADARSIARAVAGGDRRGRGPTVERRRAAPRQRGGVAAARRRSSAPTYRCRRSSTRSRSAATSPRARPGGSSRARSRPTTRARRSTATPRRRPPASSCAQPEEGETRSSSSPTGTTTSAWTGSPARSPTRPVPRRCSTRATTPRPAAPGRRSRSTRWTPPSTTAVRRQQVGGHRQPRPRRLRRRLPRRPRLDDARRRGRSTVRPGPGCSASATRARAASAAGATRAGSASTRSPTGSPTRPAQADEDGERITTILVHDANMGDAALERGCTDLVRRWPPPRPERPDRGDRRERRGRLQLHDRHHRRRGVRHRRGRPRSVVRPASRLLTYRDGHPVGVQPVTLDTNGAFTVGDYVELQPSEADVEG